MFLIESTTQVIATMKVVPLAGVCRSMSGDALDQRELCIQTRSALSGLLTLFDFATAHILDYNLTRRATRLSRGVRCRPARRSCRGRCSASSAGPANPARFTANTRRGVEFRHPCNFSRKRELERRQRLTPGVGACAAVAAAATKVDSAGPLWCLEAHVGPWRLEHALAQVRLWRPRCQSVPRIAWPRSTPLAGRRAAARLGPFGWRSHDVGPAGAGSGTRVQLSVR